MKHNDFDLLLQIQGCEMCVVVSLALLLSGCEGNQKVSSRLTIPKLGDLVKRQLKVTVEPLWARISELLGLRKVRKRPSSLAPGSWIEGQTVVRQTKITPQWALCKSYK